MTSLPFWDSTDEGEADSYDRVLLGGFDLPGICDLKLKLKRKLDVKEGSGSDYDTVADKGQRSADIKIVVSVFEREQWDGWVNEALPVIWPAAGKGKPQPQELVHPFTSANRIGAMVIESMDFDGPTDGVLTITISGYAWGQPKPSPVKTADKAKASPSSTQTADPNSAAQQNPFDPNSSLLDNLVKSLDPKGSRGTPKGPGAPSRDPNLLKP